VSIKRDDTELVRQYVEIGTAFEDEFRTVETLVSLGELPNGTRLEATASFGDGLEDNNSLELGCNSLEDGQFAEEVSVELDVRRNINISIRCEDEFPSNEAQQGGVDRR
jgi:hypothetical protein